MGIQWLYQSLGKYLTSEFSKPPFTKVGVYLSSCGGDLRYDHQKCMIDNF